MTDDAIERGREAIARAELVVAFSGAGLSAESGIPTFRDAAEGGLWSKYDPMRLASPEGFADDPELVLDWYASRREMVARSMPNPAHHALAAAESNGFVNVTQNVDDLLDRAGARRVVRLHGTLMRDRCHAGCGYEEEGMVRDAGASVCPRCGAPMRPAVVWFGESLPMDAWASAEAACSDCDVILVIGTSAAVYPAAGLIGHARARGATVLVVNTASSGASDLADVEILGPAGDVVPQLLRA